MYKKLLFVKCILASLGYENYTHCALVFIIVMGYLHTVAMLHS